jgi:hypothetical protein
MIVASALAVAAGLLALAAAGVWPARDRGQGGERVPIAEPPPDGAVEWLMAGQCQVPGVPLHSMLTIFRGGARLPDPASTRRGSALGKRFGECCYWYSFDPEHTYARAYVVRGERWGYLSAAEYPAGQPSELPSGRPDLELGAAELQDLATLREAVRDVEVDFAPGECTRREMAGLQQGRQFLRCERNVADGDGHVSILFGDGEAVELSGHIPARVSRALQSIACPRSRADGEEGPRARALRVRAEDGTGIPFPAPSIEYANDESVVAALERVCGKQGCDAPADDGFAFLLPSLRCDSRLSGCELDVRLYTPVMVHPVADVSGLERGGPGFRGRVLRQSVVHRCEKLTGAFHGAECAVFDARCEIEAQFGEPDGERWYERVNGCIAAMKSGIRKDIPELW